MDVKNTGREKWRFAVEMLLRMCYNDRKYSNGGKVCCRKNF